MFLDCFSLESITLPSNCTSIGSFSFYECESLGNLILPSSLISIGDYTFGYYSGVLTVPSTVTSIGEGAFDGVSEVYYKGSAEGSPWGAVKIN
jgi:hypothetical protein